LKNLDDYRQVDVPVRVIQSPNAEGAENTEVVGGMHDVVEGETWDDDVCTATDREVAMNVLKDTVPVNDPEVDPYGGYEVLTDGGIDDRIGSCFPATLGLDEPNRIIHDVVPTVADADYPGENVCAWNVCRAHLTQTLLRKIDEGCLGIRELRLKNDAIAAFCLREQVTTYIKNASGLVVNRAGKTRWSSNIDLARRLWNVSLIVHVLLQ